MKPVLPVEVIVLLFVLVVVIVFVIVFLAMLYYKRLCKIDKELKQKYDDLHSCVEDHY
jgi:hypothetical protein